MYLKFFRFEDIECVHTKQGKQKGLWGKEVGMTAKEDIIIYACYKEVNEINKGKYYWRRRRKRKWNTEEEVKEKEFSLMLFKTTTGNKI